MKTAGAMLFVVTLINSLLLAYGFREFSIQLTAMFLLSVIGFPLSTYLMIKSNLKNSSTSQVKEIKVIDVIYSEDECEVEGKFCIGND